MSDQIFWYATRAAGLLCWLAACGSVGVGLMMSSRALGPKPTLPWLTDLHRYLGAMAMVFLWLHMVTLGLDKFIDFGWRELFLPGVATVPGMSRFGLALGVVAAWLMAVVELTSLVRRYLPNKLWHRIHLGSYAVVLTSTVHAWQTGSDVTNRVLIGVACSTLAALTLLTGIRVYWVLTERKRRYELRLRTEPAGDLAATGDRAGVLVGAGAERPAWLTPPPESTTARDHPVPPPRPGGVDPNRPVPPPPPPGVVVGPDRPVPPPSSGVAEPAPERGRPVPPPLPGVVEPAPDRLRWSKPVTGPDQP